MDNVFIERLWRSIKHEDIYLQRLRRRPRGPCRTASLYLKGLRRRPRGHAVSDPYKKAL